MEEFEFETSLERKNERVEMIKSLVKLWSRVLYIFALLTTIFWSAWNIFAVKTLGVGQEIKWIVSGFPVLVLFLILRLNLGSFWKDYLKAIDITIFGVFIALYLVLIHFIF